MLDTVTSRSEPADRQRAGSGARRSSLLAATVFLLVGAFVAWLGGTDLFTASRAAYQLIGCLLLIGGVMMLAAAACALHPEWRIRFGRLTTVLAGVAGALVGSYLLHLQIAAAMDDLPRPDPSGLVRCLLWLGLVLITSGAGMVAFHALPPSATEMRLGPLTKKLISAVGSIGLVFGGVQWWYTHQYLPGTTGAALSIKTDIVEVSAADAPIRVFRARMTVKNVSATKVQVISSTYSARWLDIEARPATTGSDATQTRSDCFLEQLAPVQEPTCPSFSLTGYDRFGYDIREYDRTARNDPSGQDELTASRYVRQWSGDVLEVGKGVPDGMYFEADEEYAQTFLIHVPRMNVSNDDELMVRVDLVLARGRTLEFTQVDLHGPEQVASAIESRAELDDNRQALDTGGTDPRWYPQRYEVTESGIAPLSRVHELIHGARSIYVIRVLSERNAKLPSRENPYVVTCVNDARRFAGTTPDSAIRRDPTAVCPGIWTPPFLTVDENVELYGLVGANSVEQVSLAPQRADRDAAGVPR